MVCIQALICDLATSEHVKRLLIPRHAAVCLLFLLLGSPAFAAQSPGCLPKTPARSDKLGHVTRIILLGTKGGPRATKFRSEPANLLVVDGVPYVIDAGAGVSRRLAWAGYQPTQIRAVFITHHHVDHNAGLVSLISLRWFGEAWRDLSCKPLDIYGPPATKFLVHTALQYLSVSQRIFHAGVPQLKAAETMFTAHNIAHNGVVFEKKSLRITAAENTHYHFKSYTRTGARDRSYSYRFDTPTGSVVFTGDTGPSAAVTKLATGADVLVSEVCVDEFCSASGHHADPSRHDALPKSMRDEEKYHMTHEHLTPEEVGKMAMKAHVGMVILTHLVYGPKDSASLVPELTAGVRKYYSGPVIVGKDLFEYDLVKKH